MIQLLSRSRISEVLTGPNYGDATPNSSKFISRWIHCHFVAALRVVAGDPVISAPQSV
jgi:hypothetical protein